jgi:hypothetical protein
MSKQVRIASMCTVPKYKFGVEVALTWEYSKVLYKKNGDSLWKYYVYKESSQLDEYNTFPDKGNGMRLPVSYHKTCVHFVFDAKHDL